jgi:microcystin-dependent protein
MPLNKLENFIKNTEGRILYVNPNDLDSTDSISNLGNSLTKPFKTIQRALLESARFSYFRGNNNDITEKTTILLFPGEYIVDNRPGFAIKDVSGTATAVSPTGETSAAITTLSLTQDSIFDLTQDDNILYKFNSIYGGAVVPRGTSIVGLDLRKTKIRAKYVPNPTDDDVNKTAIFRITGACYFWQLSFFDSDENGLVYTDPVDFSENNKSKPTFSHHKLTCFEYADGVNIPQGYDITDLDMYYSKLSNAYNQSTGREIFEVDKYPESEFGFAKQRPEWEIVGAFAEDPIAISNIISGNGLVPTSQITVTTATEHKLTSGTPIKISGVSVEDYNVSTKVQNVLSSTQFTFLLPSFRINLPASPSFSSSQNVTVETDTVSGASPYIFNCSLRSVYGMNGMHADGSKASGFRSMVVAQFTGVSLQKDDRAFVKYNRSSRTYNGISITKQVTTELSSKSSSLNSSQIYHLDSDAIYRTGWEPSHIKISNDAFVQIVSVFAIGFNVHFNVESGGDASITNSNSNFGQISLVSDGFRKSSFQKDNNGYITSIITPRSIDTNNELDIDWVSFDVQKTINAGISSHLYLFGFTAFDDVPPTVIQGYRIGCRKNDLLRVNFAGTIRTATIRMIDSFSGTVAIGTNTSEKSYRVSSGPSSNVFTLTSQHGLRNGEKIRIFSDDGDLPENINTNTVYYAITNGLSNNQVKLSSSKTNADTGISIDVYGGTNLKIVSRSSDKIAGDIGHSIQYDTNIGNWYIHTNSDSTIYSEILSQGVSGIGERTPVSYVKRIEDKRSLDEKLYKVRYVIPQQANNSRNPEDGYIIQESSSTGIGSDGYTTTQTISSSDLIFNKNLRILSKCSVVGSAISAVSETPHNLVVGDIINVLNVSSTNNTNALNNEGYNGSFKVVNVISDKIFLYSEGLTDIFGVTRNPGTFTNDLSIRNTSLPRFERNDLKRNYFIYRSDVISEYIENVQDGIYHLYVLNSDNAISSEFTNLKYSQNITDLYPQFDKDNVDDNPYASKTFAKRSPLGEVVTNDLKKSVTRETVDSIAQTFGYGLKVSNVVTSFSGSVGVATLTFDREHGLNGITTFTNLVGGTGHNNGTYFNVKLFNNSSLTSWNGATSKVIVSGGSVTSAEIISRGSAYTAGTLYFDINDIGGSTDATIQITNAGISSAIGNSIQITGKGTVDDIHTRITQIPSTTKVAFAITTGDPIPVVGQYVINNGPSLEILSSSYNSTTGITTFVTSPIPHGLLLGNKFTILNSSGANLGQFFVAEKVGVNTFNATTNQSLTGARYIVRNGYSATNAISDKTQENISVRGSTPFDNEILILSQNIDTETDFQVSLPYSGIGTMSRFPLGSYIQVDEEIMRVSINSLTGVSNNRLNVIRGVLGTKTQSHSSGSLIKKIKPIPIELRRPSISRASGHTFEYLGYGPGNYSTGLPQIQVKTLTEREDFLAQSQERSGGIVVYTGMSSDGDFFIGNTKYSSSSGTQKTFDIPIPTITGEDPSRSSVIFDEVVIKERLLVEGGNSSTILSQFDGPVTFNNEIKVNDNVTIDGDLSVSGDISVSDSLTITNNANVSGTLQVSGEMTVNTGIVPDTDEGAYLGTASKPFSDAHIGEVRIAQTNDNTIDTATGNLTLNATTGSTVAIQTNTTIKGNLDLTTSGAGSATNSGRISANYLDVPNISPVGSIMIWPGGVDTWPTETWTLCDGRSLNTYTYKELHEIISNTYGGTAYQVGVTDQPAAVTTFNVPDLRERFIIGIGGPYTLNQTGGSKDSIVVSHTHGITDPGHQHTYADFFGVLSGSRYGSEGERLHNSNTFANRSTAINTTGISINSTGESGNDANLPPYRALYYIIRTV